MVVKLITQIVDSLERIIFIFRLLNTIDYVTAREINFNFTTLLVNYLETVDSNYYSEDAQAERSKKGTIRIIDFWIKHFPYLELYDLSCLIYLILHIPSLILYTPLWARRILRIIIIIIFTITLIIFFIIAFIISFIAFIIFTCNLLEHLL